MKCLAVFSTLPDLLYLWKDAQFEKHLIETAIQQHLIDPSEPSVIHDEEAILSYAGHFFSPLVTSNKYMAELGNSYRSMICENGFIFVMNELSNLYFVAVCGDGEESELFLQRKINVFNYLLRLYYGPCAAEHLKPDYQFMRKQTWGNLHELLLTWQTLCQQEQMFLVEALERLHVNPQLNNVSLNLLGDVLQRTNRDGHTVHALLLVNNKLLGLYSNEHSPELKASDILMLIVLVKNKFKYNDDTVPKSVYRTPPPLSDPVTQLKNDETLFKFHAPESNPVDVEDSTSLTSSSKLEYHSAHSTPQQADSFHTPQISSVAFVPDNMDRLDTISGHNLFHDLSMNEADLELILSSSEDEEEKNSSDEKEHSDEEETSSDQHDIPEVINEEKKEDNISDGSKEETTEYFQQFIFLQAGDCGYAPHTAHCLLLDKATVLIVISQNRHMNLATYIQTLLHCVTKILKLKSHKVQSSRAKLFENTERCINRIKNASFKHTDLESERLFHSVKLFERSWKLALDADLLDFIHSDTTAEFMPQKLETCLGEIIKSTKTLFTYLFISHTQRRLSRYEKQLKVILNVREMALRRLSHFSAYLQVRGQRNVTMTAYHNDFPGLVHFIYVNRSIDQLIAPTINVNNDSNSHLKLPIYIVIKQRIWDLWQYTETMVLNGYTSLIVRDGDFSYSYFLWFEDMHGKPLLTQKSLKELHETSPTGIMSGSFYKNIIRHLFPSESPASVHCYELLCMHIGVVSNHFVATSCRKLTRLLWEASGEANSPINLL